MEKERKNPEALESASNFNPEKIEGMTDLEAARKNYHSEITEYFSTNTDSIRAAIEGAIRVDPVSGDEKRTCSCSFTFDSEAISPDIYQQHNTVGQKQDRNMSVVPEVVKEWLEKEYGDVIILQENTIDIPADRNSTPIGLPGDEVNLTFRLANQYSEMPVEA
jgi:hypothetical protein